MARGQTTENIPLGAYLSSSLALKSAVDDEPLTGFVPSTSLILCSRSEQSVGRVDRLLWQTSERPTCDRHGRGC